jgi:uncharacterized protein YutE (UPF0331/DUF86 family)
MSPSKISRRIVLDRIAWVDRMIAEIRALPLADQKAFLADSRNVWTAESCLRRALEALSDIGRHILAKGFALGVSEYREIAEGLEARGVLSPEQTRLLKTLAGYRNRLVHFYHEVSIDELYQICASQLEDVILVRDALHSWFSANPQMIDNTL